MLDATITIPQKFRLVKREGDGHIITAEALVLPFSFIEEKGSQKGTPMKSWVFRPLRRSIQGAALKTRKLLKKFDQNFNKTRAQKSLIQTKNKLI